jgi:hypothetical protein
MTALAGLWRSTFFQTVRQHRNASLLQDASRKGQLGKWTAALTDVVVSTCRAMGWHASAKGHKLDLLPVPRHEYLSQDVMAFAKGDKRWRFPVAVMELENRQTEDYIAYSLWKVLCVRADLRIVFCYRRSVSDVAALVRFLQNDVIGSMGISGRMALSGQILLVVGSRDEVETFPYGYFKWWELERNTGTFKIV